MGVKDANTLKGYFNNGDVPSENDFIDLIDTMFGLGGGDMLRSVYDPDLDNVVESADYAGDSDKLDGQDGSYYAPSTKGVTNGDSHDHSGGDGAQIDHGDLDNIGTNSHAQLDLFVGSKGAALGLATLDAWGKVVENPTNAQQLPAALKIPLSDSNSKIDEWISDGTTTTKGKLKLASNGVLTSGAAVEATDSRLSDSRTPTAHNLLSSSHGDTLSASAVAGDIIIANATPKWSRLAKGTRGYHLVMGASLPAWVAENGWVDVSGSSWTYVSASSFRISGDVTSIFRKGLFIKWTQTTVKYGVVESSSYSSPNTTVNIIVNSDYTIANATISGQSISFVNNPEGWPGWFNYTPTFSGFSANPTGTISRYYPEVGKMTVEHREALAGTSNATSFSVSAPVACVSITNGAWQTPGMGTDNGTIGATPALVQIASASPTTIACYKDWAATAWTSSGSKRIIFMLQYEW